jgi:hypothetical protein
MQGYSIIYVDTTAQRLAGPHRVLLLYLPVNKLLAKNFHTQHSIST